MEQHYDYIIIGAGLSGLAAGIRLAHFEHSVAIIEAHSLCGGLNSWYRRKGQMIDVGLHAMTNFAPKKGKKGPLTKLLRQLRIPYDSLELREQKKSRVVFSDQELEFSNDFQTLLDSISVSFPGESAGFQALAEAIDLFDEVSIDPPKLSARQEIGKYLKNEKLIDMLLTPLMFYGNPDEHDMDFAQFAVMWKSIYRSGFARPESGMKPIIDMLVSRFKASGGTLVMNTAVKHLQIENGTAVGVVLDGGNEVSCDNVFSSAGHNETLALIPEYSPPKKRVRQGKLSFVEQVLFLDKPVTEFGLSDSIVFFNFSDVLTYERPQQTVDYTNGVICCPENFDVTREGRNELRVTLRASYPEWSAVAEQGKGHYESMKTEITSAIIKLVEEKFGSKLSGHVVFSDLFTPLTIERFSRHIEGAVYGSPDKYRSGEIGVKNVKIIGTDQGFLGIVGAMLSGITIANIELDSSK